MISRRCTQRGRYFRPDWAINCLVGYVVGYVQMRFGFLLHYLIVMSTHVHYGVTDQVQQDKDSDVPHFTRDMHSLIARARNRFLKRRENLWSAGNGTYNFLASDLLEDMIERYVYALCNPTTDGLVPHYRKWPGLVLTPGPSGKRTYRFRRPPFFFSWFMPEYVEVVVTAPKSPLSPREFMTEVHRRVNERNAETAALMRAEGRKFAGAAYVTSESPFSRSTSKEKSTGGDPQYASSDRAWRREQYLLRQNFLQTYKLCLEAYRAGDTDVVFPNGTFKMVDTYGARCLTSSGHDP